MSLSKLDDMFTESHFDEYAGESRAASPLGDLDFGIGKLSVSPVPYESTCSKADDSSGIMVTSDVSATGGLLSVFDSEQQFLRNDIAKFTTEIDNIASVSEANLHGQRPDEGQGSGAHDSSDSARMHGPSIYGDAAAQVDEIDRTQKLNGCLIVYASSRRNSSRSIDTKLNQNNYTKDSSRKFMIAQNDSLSDLKSLQISRRKRSLHSKTAKSSVWGLERLPAFEENNEHDPCLSNRKEVGRVSVGHGEEKVIRDQTGQKPVQKSSTPTGRISLKIKIGNQSFGVVDVDKKSIVSQKKNSALCDIKESKFHPGKMLSPYESNLEDVMTSDASALGTHLDVTDSMENKSLRASTEKRCSDPGTSPDSEVINSVRDAPLHNRGSQDMQDSPVAGVSFMGVSSLSLPKLQSKKGKKTTGAKTKNKDKASLVPGLKQKAMDISNCDDASIVPLGNPFQNACSRERVSRGTVDGSWMTNSEIPCSTTKSLGACSNGQKFLKCSRAKGGCTGKTGILNLPRKKGKSSRKKGDKSNLIFKHQIDVKDDATGLRSKVENLLEAGNQTSRDLGEVGDLSTNSAGPGFVSSSGWTNCQYVPPSNAWVLCDECQKWRRIPATLADQIDQTNSQWTCKDNTDKDFADCSIPQEKSNSEINEELDISDASCDEDADDTYLKSNKNKSTAAKQSSWTLIKSNIFLHRRRKTQSIDEVMVCHCKPPSDGKMGCGAECLNRMLNIECVEGTCPCGELCSNQQFQKRMYAKLKWLRCGKKGFGLQALQDISEGQFLIEYVGEVLDIHAHEARQREYALQGHKHFYFMTLNGSEVIDACAKGNLGRFINHSCDPNCQTEKWMVNGEVCVGLFAIRDIKKGEEVTFDYNYVRVLGAAAKKCVCGSPNCRGYIGGDAKNFEVIVQEDSDDEYAEPVMICEDREMKNDWTDIMTQSMFEKEIEYRYDLDKDRYRMKNVNAAVQSESATSDTSIEKAVVSSTSSECSRAATATQSDSFALATSKAESESLLSKMSSPVNLMEASLRSEEIINSTIPGKLQPEAVSKKKLKYGNMGGKDESPKSNSLAKTHYSSLSIKSNFMNDKANGDCDKQTAVRPKSKILSSLPRNSHVEAVEGKLNELLDTEGGISKRKDASRGYLKLLFLTAASGTNGHGEAIQSNRALSMILDALLKTKSRTVLVDIINKNGLQMLHNIMKRYRKEFIKTPILRKLLKVLEYLAVRGILTLEHIAGSSSRPGVESFKDSILTLTEHADKQVHQIARNFRDKWIPKSLRKSCFMELGDGKMEFRQHSSYSCSFGTNGRTRKRKSRWDNPTEESMYPKKPNIDNDIPPGFLSPIHMAPATACSTALSFHETGIFSKHPSDILLADSQERFAACLPVSYGIPSSVVQQFGVLNAEAAPVWTVAPGLPFRPFPPLPPCASDKGEQPTLVAKCVVEPVERMGQDRDACYSGNERSTSSSLDPPMASEHPEEGSYNLGRKYFRQQKWNHSKLAPPWLRMKNGWGHSASTRNSLRRGLDFGNGTN